MMAEFYSTVQEVIEYTGCDPEMLGISPAVDNRDAEMRKRIQSWLIVAKDFIDRDRNRDFHTEDKIPGVIDNIALRMVVNFIRSNERNRNTSVVELGSGKGELKTIQGLMMTNDIRADLRRVPRKLDIRILVKGQAASEES